MVEHGDEIEAGRRGKVLESHREMSLIDIRAWFAELTLGDTPANSAIEMVASTNHLDERHL